MGSYLEICRGCSFGLSVFLISSLSSNDHEHDFWVVVANNAKDVKEPINESVEQLCVPNASDDTCIDEHGRKTVR